jgi:hypothetical protein
MFSNVLNWFLNVGIAVTGILVLVGWIRQRAAVNFRDIDKSEISADLTAGDDLLADALAELELRPGESILAPRLTTHSVVHEK